MFIIEHVMQQNIKTKFVEEGAAVVLSPNHEHIQSIVIYG